MTITVQISDFRNNMAMYLAKLKVGQIIDIKKGGKYLAKLSKHPKAVETREYKDADEFMAKLKKIWSMQAKSKKKTNYSMRVDEILYGK
ncbi:hypothetical protein HYV64_03765 [Candidatus Shapirobacteria bacterium]|nr:hypothetical protein [Candidatus Shapirobacteria bacterium]